MALIAEFHPEARAEFDAAMEYYELVRPGLGSAFLAEVQAATEYAQRLPQAGAPVSDDLRRTFIRRFPYYLLYAAEATRTYILAVAHFRRRPGYWRSRSGA
ncbi:MAG: type II toxin-antitoxin system RelE/ParE family toxin [Gemmatimonas sp.]